MKNKKRNKSKHCVESLLKTQETPVEIAKEVAHSKELSKVVGDRLASPIKTTPPC